MKTYHIYIINTIICFIGAIATREIGWINCTLQVAFVTYVLIKEDR